MHDLTDRELVCRRIVQQVSGITVSLFSLSLSVFLSVCCFRINAVALNNKSRVKFFFKRCYRNNTKRILPAFANAPLRDGNPSGRSFFATHRPVSVKLHPRDVRLSVVSVRGVNPMSGRSAMLHRNLRSGEGRV